MFYELESIIWELFGVKYLRRFLWPLAGNYKELILSFYFRLTEILNFPRNAELFIVWPIKLISYIFVHSIFNIKNDPNFHVNTPPLQGLMLDATLEYLFTVLICMCPLFK